MINLKKTVKSLNLFFLDLAMGMYHKEEWEKGKKKKNLKRQNIRTQTDLGRIHGTKNMRKKRKIKAKSFSVYFIFRLCLKKIVTIMIKISKII